MSVYLPFEVAPPPHCIPHPIPEYPTAILPFSCDTFQLLSNFLEICDDPIMYDFLFSNESVQVPALTNPATVANSLSCHFTERYIAHSQSSTTSLVTHIDGQSLIAPFLIVGKFVVGVGVKEVGHSNGTVSCDHFRFVGNEEISSYVVVRTVRPSVGCTTDDTPKEMILLEHFLLHTPAHRSRIVMGMDSIKLKKVIESKHKASPLAMHSSLKMVQVIKEWRECDRCGSALKPECNCHIGNTSKGPLDLISAKQGMMVHIGAWHGSESLHLAGKGSSAFSGALGSRYDLRVVCDYNVANRLIKWALRDCVTGTTPGPKQLEYPLQNKDKEEVNEKESELMGYFGNLDTNEDIEWVNEICKSSDRNKNGLMIEDKEIQESSSGTNSKDNSEESEYKNEKEGSDTIDDMKAVRLKLRREKNRDSARKSNYKKKIQNEQLKKELITQQTKKSKLEEIEAKLRADNSRLRRLVSEG